MCMRTRGGSMVSAEGTRSSFPCFLLVACVCVLCTKAGREEHCPGVTVCVGVSADPILEYTMPARVKSPFLYTLYTAAENSIALVKVRWFSAIVRLGLSAAAGM